MHSSSEMGVYVTAPNVFTDEVTEFVHTFTADTLAKYQPSGRIATASSIETTIGDLIFVPGRDRHRADRRGHRGRVQRRTARHQGVDRQPRSAGR